MTADEAILANHAAAREQEKFAEAHRALDAQGVSHSVYGQAAREKYMRQPAIHPRETVAEPFAQRIFTRSEVLTVLSTLKATTEHFNAREALDGAMRVFERME